MTSAVTKIDIAFAANANGHFITGRIDVNKYWMYSRQFGFFTSFILYLVNDSNFQRRGSIWWHVMHRIAMAMRPTKHFVICYTGSNPKDE